jgi:hypothetical protein
METMLSESQVLMDGLSNICGECLLTASDSFMIAVCAIACLHVRELTYELLNLYLD